MKSAAEKIEAKAQKMAAIAARLADELAALAGDTEDEAAAAVAAVEADRDELLEAIREALDAMDAGEIDSARLILAEMVKQQAAA
jgi:hypothetical protein